VAHHWSARTAENDPLTDIGASLWSDYALELHGAKDTHTPARLTLWSLRDARPTGGANPTKNGRSRVPPGP